MNIKSRPNKYLHRAFKYIYTIIIININNTIINKIIILIQKIID